MFMKAFRLAIVFTLVVGAALSAQGRRGGGPPAPPLTLPPDTDRITALKTQAAADIDKMFVQAQQMNDMIFSFAELGFQEFETKKYLVGLLQKNGFQVEEGVAGIPTAFMATWSQGGANAHPIIALGSDFDDI